MSAEYDAVIIAGGHIDRDFFGNWLRGQGILKGKVCDKLIAADAGLKVCQILEVIPSHIVGDFDSAGTDILIPYQDNKNIMIHRYQPEKNWTDTEIAFRLAASRGSRRIALWGATGTRLDHVLGCLQLLQMAREMQIDLVMMDEHNRVTLHDASFELERSTQWGKYVSFFPYGREIKPLRLKGFAYDVEDFTLRTDRTRAVSNEIREESARVEFAEGMILCIESTD